MIEDEIFCAVCVVFFYLRCEILVMVMLFMRFWVEYESYTILLIVVCFYGCVLGFLLVCRCVFRFC